MLLLVDLDGVVYRGVTPIPGVAAVLARRAAAGDDIVYVTNNSMFHRTDYVARLRGMGAPADAEHVVSSPRAAALYLAALEPPVRRVLAVGASGLQRELVDAGFEVVPVGEAAARAEREGLNGFEAAGRPDAVVVGLDPLFTYRRLWVAADAVRAGARLVATNRDPVYPFEHGVQPGSGAVVAAIQATTEASVVSLGKPEPLLLEMAARSVGAVASEAIVIGDGLLTDLAAAHAVGARCLFMLTGVTTRAQLEALPPELAPAWVATDATELEAILEGLAATV